MNLIEDAQQYITAGDRRRAIKSLEKAVRELRSPAQRLPKWVVVGAKFEMEDTESCGGFEGFDFTVVKVNGGISWSFLGLGGQVPGFPKLSLWVNQGDRFRRVGK
jgi:hypothetical protein